MKLYILNLKDKEGNELTVLPTFCEEPAEVINLAMRCFGEFLNEDCTIEYLGEYVNGRLKSLRKPELVCRFNYEVFNENEIKENEIK